jgi:hypothetical protein
MPTIPVHLDLGFALLILGVLALLAFSPWFRRFALVCVALLAVAAGIFYLKINRENEQAMAQECVTEPSIDKWGPKRTIPHPPGWQPQPGSCERWLTDHPQAKAERERAIEQEMVKECAAILAHSNDPPPGLEPSPKTCKQWLAEHPQAKAEMEEAKQKQLAEDCPSGTFSFGTSEECLRWRAEHPQARRKE